MKYYSINEQDYCYDEIEEAVGALWEDNPDLKIGDMATIWEGEYLSYLASEFAPPIVEEMLNRACDEMVEYYDTWTFNSEEENALQKVVNEAIDKWASDNNKHPAFYGIQNIRPIELRFIDKNGGFEIINKK